MTNFKRIQSLDIRAMAEFLHEFQEDAYDVCIMVNKEDCNGQCTECIRAWLEDEAEIKLKPCPWCGEVPTKDADDYWYAVDHKPDCFLSRATSEKLIFDDTMIGAWNRRMHNAAERT